MTGPHRAAKRIRNGLFVAEGTSDHPLADIVESLFISRGVDVNLSRPDFSRLEKVKKDVASRVTAGCELLAATPEVVVVHRDADNAGLTARREEIVAAVAECAPSSIVVPVIPIRMTEAWLLLDEEAIRFVAGNPRGREPLGLPKRHEVERVSDPKERLRNCLLDAASVTGRRRTQLARRFPENRRQLLERLDPDGPVTSLPSWIELSRSVETIVDGWCREHPG